MSHPPSSARGAADQSSGHDWTARLQASDPIASILAVDDRRENLVALEAALEPLGQRLVTASSGEAALSSLVREDFAVVLLDVCMPGMDGLETAALIKGLQRSRHTPIIFLTASDVSVDLVTRAYRHGGVDFLAKPINLEVLRSKVMVFVELFVLGERVKRQSRFLQALFESLQTAIVACDAAGNVTTYNGATRELFGLRGGAAPALRGARCRLYEADGVSPIAPAGEPLARVLRGEDVHDMEMVVVAGEGRARTVLASGQPITDAGGVTLGAVVSMNDITARKAAERAAADNLKHLVSSNKELEQFAYVASHDLQEPLRMVASYTQLLARRYRGKLDADADEFIAFAVEGVTRMQSLINDLLIYARIGSHADDVVQADSGAALDRALANLKTTIADTGAAISRTAMPVVRADPTQLDQLFQNLLSNALKFRRDERPEVAVGAEALGDLWHFSVRDNGIGIDPAYFDRIFVIFQRLHNRDKYEGTGIGLSICKKIVERHGGTMWVESRPGSGSTFHFTLPAGGPS